MDSQERVDFPCDAGIPVSAEEDAAVAALLDAAMARPGGALHAAVFRVLYNYGAVEGVRQRLLRQDPLVARVGPDASHFIVRQSVVPVGLAFRSAGNGWALLDFVRWESVALDERASEVAT